MEISPVNYNRGRANSRFIEFEKRACSNFTSRDDIDQDTSASPVDDFLQRNGKLIATTGFSAALFAQNATDLGLLQSHLRFIFSLFSFKPELPGSSSG